MSSRTAAALMHLLRIFTSLVPLFKFSAVNCESLIDSLQSPIEIPPRLAPGPLDVKIGIYIESLGKFRETEMSFDVDLYLYSSWRDPSLNHTKAEHVLISDVQVKDRIWMPDLYFSNARTSKSHDITMPNFSLFVARDGSVAYSNRVTLTVACNLNLVHYPMDQQTCVIRTLSYAHVASEVNITWFLENPIRYNPGIGLPEFEIVDIHPAYCDGTYMYAIMENSYKIDSFSCLEAVIHLRRSIGYHLVQSFIPTGLIVVISWVSFWIDRRAVPARVTLSFTTLLSLSTLGNGLRFGLPQVSYAKSIDLWFGACMFFIFASLLEYAIINSYMRQADKYEKLAKQYARKVSEDSTDDIQTPASKKSMLLFSSPRIKIVDNGEFAANRYSIYNSYSPSKENITKAKKGVLSPRMDSSEDQLSERERGRIRNGSSKNEAVGRNHQSPTGLALLSDDDWVEKNPTSCKKQPVSGRGYRFKKKHGREKGADNPILVNHCLHRGYIFSRKALKIDQYSRIAFPLVFGLFNAVYWYYYMWYVRQNQP